jgi:hypothetical protein
MVLLRRALPYDVRNSSSDRELDQLNGFYNVHLLSLHASTAVAKGIWILGYSQT